MKLKKLYMFIWSLTISIIFQVVVFAQPTTSIKPVSPAASPAGAEFWVDIKVGEPNVATNLFGVSFVLNYNNNFLNYVTSESGSWFGSDLVFFPSNDAINGKLSIGISRKAGSGGISGSGVIARVKFSALSITPNNTNVDFTLSNITANGPDGLSITLTPLAATTLIGNSQNPQLSVLPGSLTFSNQLINTSSTPQSYALNGSSLTSNVTVNAPLGYRAFTSSGGTYQPSLTLTPSGGGIAQMIYVKFMPTAIQSYPGVILNSSSGAASQPVTVSGEGVNQTGASIKPVSPASSPPGAEFWVDIKVGDPNVVTNLFGASFVLNYNKAYLTFVTAESVSWFGTDLVFFPSDDAVNGKLSIGISRKSGSGGVSGSGVIARVKFISLSSTPNNTSLDFILSNLTANDPTGVSITLSPLASSTMIVIPQGAQLNIQPGSISFGNQIINTTSSPQSYSLTGSYLTGNVTINAPTGYLLCTSSGGTYLANLNLIPTAGNISQTIYVKFAPLAEQNYPGAITNSSPGVTSQSVTVSGQGVSASNPVLSLSNTAGVPNDSLVISLNAQNLLNIGAITIKIQFDPAKLAFGRALNWDSQISGALAGGANGTLNIVWDGIAGANFADNKIADLKFLYFGSSSATPVTFVTAQCEIAALDGSIVSTITYVNGSVCQGISITGQVSYANTSASTLSNVKVYLNTQTAVLDSSLTNANGIYTFNGVVNGTYTLSCSSVGAWGGVNSTDALYLRQYQIGARTFDSLQAKAADVNHSNTITSTDALLIRQRTAGIITSFTGGDWVFENPTVAVSGSNATKNIRGLCTGDVNGSYVPVPAKSTASILLLNNGDAIVNNNGTIELPVTISKAAKISALTLLLNYISSNAAIAGVKSNIEGLDYSITNNSVKIAWDGLKPLELDGGDKLLSIVLKVDSKGSKLPDFKVCLGQGSEIADENGNVVESSTINIPEARKINSSGYQLSQNYPNPFNPITTIKFSLPTESNVKLVVTNSLGQAVKVIVDGLKPAGTFEAMLDASNLSSGIYFCTMVSKSLDGTQNFQTVNKLILLK